MPFWAPPPLAVVEAGVLIVAKANLCSSQIHLPVGVVEYDDVP